MSVLLAACTATGGDQPIAMGSPAFNQMGPTAALMADVATAESSGDTFGTVGSDRPEGKDAAPETVAAGAEASSTTSEAAYEIDDLPQTVAAAPSTRPQDEAGGAATTAQTSETPPKTQSPSAQPKNKGLFASIFGNNGNAATQTAAAAEATQVEREPAHDGGTVAQTAEPARVEDGAVETAEAAKPQAPAAAEPAQSDEAVKLKEADEAVADADQKADGEPVEEQTAAVEEPKKKGFLASFFGSQPQSSAGQAVQRQAVQRQTSAAAAPQSQSTPTAKPIIAAEAQAKPLVQLASAEQPVRRSASLASLGNQDGALPGVRQSALFEITRKTGIDDDTSDVDLYEGEYHGQIQVASAAGLARLAPNGLLKQRESVDVACLKPSLVRVLKTVERRFGKRLVVTSGYRSPSYNKKVRGARRSMHMFCAAADVQVPGVSKWELAKFVRSLQGRGGVGTYCHTESVHIDVGPERDWNWRCRRRRG